MDIFQVFLGLSVLAGFLMAFNLGANDVANAMASAVGARAISVKQAIFIAGTLNFVGAVFFGSHVTATISKGIINPGFITNPKLFMIGMFASLISAALWVFIATLTALPVSSTHSIIGSILGFGIVAGGPHVVNWKVLGGVVLSWLISPLFAATISFIVFTLIRRNILMREKFVEHTIFWVPIWIVLTCALVILSFFYKTPFGKKMGLPISVSLGLVLLLGTIIYIASRLWVSKFIKKVEQSSSCVEEVFRKIQIGTSCYVAMSQGANDVANAIGPVVAVYSLAKYHAILPKVEIPIFFLALGGFGIATGIMLFGKRVIATVGEKITSLTNTRGFAVDFGTATTVLLASNMGLPVSTTHSAVGGVVGVGMARGFSAVDFGVLIKIIIYWVLTVPIAAFTSIFIFQLLKWTLLG
ncbi:inorganic phosphate transporter [Desulfothermus naphthae]